MAKITLGGNPTNTIGDLPSVGSTISNHKFVNNDMEEVSLDDYKGKQIILNIFPSVDTGTCATSVRKFNEKAANLDNTVVLCISRDLPFAQKRFCGAEGIENAVTLSDFRNHDFSKTIGTEIEDGPFTSLNARAIIVLDAERKVKHTELVGEVADEPNYESALNAL